MGMLPYIGVMNKMTSVAVNQQAPDFVLLDYEGSEFKLSKFKNEKNILLVLNRGFV